LGGKIVMLGEAKHPSVVGLFFGAQMDPSLGR
jgi:hypothetical protein